ncbi:G-protein coupled receptor 84 [Drosophila elegans]|uniref:G-protein coupled receptor 84 n=1 Tax=Drosophila elegans TaxID=30023 RepID=UPI001BC84BAF|nr:G-protein coupled receptor 84 [Drosophila elegans]
MIADPMHIADMPAPPSASSSSCATQKQMCNSSNIKNNNASEQQQLIRLHVCILTFTQLDIRQRFCRSTEKKVLLSPTSKNNPQKKIKIWFDYNFSILNRSNGGKATYKLFKLFFQSNMQHSKRITQLVLFIDILYQIEDRRLPSGPLFGWKQCGWMCECGEFSLVQIRRRNEQRALLPTTKYHAMFPPGQNQNPLPISLIPLPPLPDPYAISKAVQDPDSLDLDVDVNLHLDGGRQELFEGYSDELLTIAWVACIVFIIVGVPGNLLTIVALSRGRQTRNSTAIFIINLSCSDLLFGCFNLPLAASTFMERAWTHGDLWCRLFPMLRYGLLAVSLLSVSLITINRYIIIAHPRQYPRIYQRRYLALMVAGTWVTTFSIMIPTWRGVWGIFGLDVSIGSCSILHDRYGRSPKEFLFIAAFMVPCICIVICYARIFLLVRKAAIRAGTAGKSNVSDVTPSSTTQQNQAPAMAMQKRPEKASTSSGEAQDAPIPGRPFVVEEQLAYIDDNASADSLPISYSIRRRDQEQQLQQLQLQQLPVDANVVLKERDQEKFSLGRSQTQLEMGKSAGKNPITTSLRTSFTRFSPRKSHYVSMGNTSNASSIYPGRMSAKDRRLLKMILVIFVWFVICYLPITVAKIWKSATELHWFNIAGYLLIYLTTCINPLIYVLMSSEYRRAYWNLLRCHGSPDPHKQQRNQVHSNAKRKHLESTNRQVKATT